MGTAEEEGNWPCFCFTHKQPKLFCFCVLALIPYSAQSLPQDVLPQAEYVFRDKLEFHLFQEGIPNMWNSLISWLRASPPMSFCLEDPESSRLPALCQASSQVTQSVVLNGAE